MEMRAAEDVEIGEDIVSKLSPISVSLYESFLFTHCSLCFFPISSSVLYCSDLCKLSDFSLHLASDESHLSEHSSIVSSPILTSDIRAALRLLCYIPTASSSPAFPHRIGNLLTNHARLMVDPTMSSAIREGATAMAAARRSGIKHPDETDVVLEEAALCCVISNAVEVVDKTGRALGIAIYDAPFSWINHSCSPNAFYSFVISSPDSASEPEGSTGLRISPHIMKKDNLQGYNGVNGNIKYQQQQGRKLRYGPRISLRSIKRILKGEAITVSYTDLLQPTALRQSDLQSKYQFTCCCSRCAVSPPSLVDSALEGVYSLKLDSTATDFDESSYKHEANLKLADYIEEAIDEFLTNGDPEECCKEIEHILSVGMLVEQSQTGDRKPELNFMLNPLHHASLNAYTALTSAYKVRASHLMVPQSEINGDPYKAFDMSKTSAAYSLFLAAAVHHLFCLESSLTASAAKFWTSAGESLLSLARTPTWILFAKQQEVPMTNFSSLPELKCSNCSMMATLGSSIGLRHLQDVSAELLRCVTNISQEVWSFLVEGCDYLRKFRNPFEKNCCHEKHLGELYVKSGAENEAKGSGYCSQVSVFQLGVHCLLYGGVLTKICYGPNSHIGSCIQTLMDQAEDYLNQS